MKTIRAVVLAVAMLFLAGAFAVGAEMDWSAMNDVLGDLGLKAETVQDIKDMLERRTPPILKMVSALPISPAANEEVKIKASIVNGPDMDGKSIDNATIYYSTNYGETWTAIPMDQNPDDDRIWTGAIPGMPSGTEVIYGIQAINMYDEMYSEAVCYEDTGKTLGEVTLECEEEKNPELCMSRRPVGCMFPMALPEDEYKKGEENKLLSDDLNIRVTRFGASENNVYFNISTAGGVTEGTMSPQNVHIYVAAWLNPDKASGSDMGLDALLKQGAVMLYAPLNTSAPCSMYYFTGMQLMSDKISGTCEMDKKHLIYSVKKSAIGSNPSGTLEMMFMSFLLRSITPAETDLMDTTLFTRVRFIERGYTVK